jgi:VanZ family protein
VLKRIFLLAALFWTGVILFFCLEDASNIPQIDIENIDKVIHAFFHFVFTFLWFLFLKKKLKSTSIFKPLLYSFVFSFVFGVAVEIMQELFTTTRSADVLDELANLSGAILAILTIIVINKYNHIIDKI